MSFHKGNQWGKLNKGRRVTWGAKVSSGLVKAYQEGRATGFQKGHAFMGDLSKPNYFQKGKVPWNKDKKTGITPANAKPLITKQCLYCKKQFQVRGRNYKKMCCNIYCKNQYFRGKNHPWYGRHQSKEHIEKLKRLFTGTGGPNWKGGRTEKNKVLRSSSQFREWREKVFKRDNYTCQFCGARSVKGNRVELHPDHIEPFALFPELRFEISNGRTLCAPCHRKTPTWGLVHRKD